MTSFLSAELRYWKIRNGDGWGRDLFSLFPFNFLCHLVMCPVAIKKTTSIGAVCKFKTQNCSSCSMFSPSVPWRFHDFAVRWEWTGFQECNFSVFLISRGYFFPQRETFVQHVLFKAALCSEEVLMSSSTAELFPVFPGPKGCLVWFLVLKESDFLWTVQ